MILFFIKKTGRIFAIVDGRVHSEQQMKCTISDSTIDKKDIGKMIIGWEETNETEETDVQTEKLEEAGKGLFRKVRITEKVKTTKKKEHNLDKFDILQRFEDTTPESPFDYKIKDNKLVKNIEK